MLAQKSTGPVTDFLPSVVQLLKLTFDDACSRYVELFMEREETDSQADRLSQQTLLVFLVDDTDILPAHRLQRHDTQDSGKIRSILCLFFCFFICILLAETAVPTM